MPILPEHQPDEPDRWRDRSWRPGAAHPAWCDRDHCETRGEHRSRTMSANPAGQHTPGVRLRLRRSTHPAGMVLITLDVDGHPLELTNAQARVLGWLLQRVTRQLTGPHPNQR